MSQSFHLSPCSDFRRHLFAHRVGRAFVASDARPPPWTTLHRCQTRRAPLIEARSVFRQPEPPLNLRFRRRQCGSKPTSLAPRGQDPGTTYRSGAPLSNPSPPVCRCALPSQFKGRSPARPASAGFSWPGAKEPVEAAVGFGVGTPSFGQRASLSNFVAPLRDGLPTAEIRRLLAPMKQGIQHSNEDDQVNDRHYPKRKRPKHLHDRPPTKQWSGDSQCAPPMRG